jgi:hypothetical protein
LNKILTIKYIHHGIAKTGGAVHEQFLIDIFLKKVPSCYDIEYHNCFKNRIYKSVANIKLLVWSYFQAGAKINFVVVRSALAAILRNICTSNKVLIFMHNYDPGDYRSAYLKFYLSLLFFFLKKIRSDRFSVIVVAPFWKAYFQKRFPFLKIMYFPNFFDLKKYQSYRTGKKEKKILMGQYSPKNDPQIFTLCTWLHQAGWFCYFSTLNPALAFESRHFTVKYQKYEEYLSELGTCSYSLALTYINEGWNRMAFESMLVGTQVIGYEKGGLGDMIRGANAISVNNIEETFEQIMKNTYSEINHAFLEEFDKSNADKYMEKMIQQLGM